MMYDIASISLLICSSCLADNFARKSFSPSILDFKIIDKNVKKKWLISSIKSQQLSL